MQCLQAILGEQSRLFILNQLHHGLQISQHLCNKDILNGHVISRLSTNDNIELIQNLSSDEFNYGGIASLEGSLRCLTEFLMKFMSESPNRLCIFEDAGAEPSFTWVIRDKPRIFTYNKEVYHVAFSQQCTEEGLKHAIRTADSTWILIGVATSVPDIQEWIGKVELTNNDIQELAQRAEHIIVGAFDGEGYLIWSESQQLEPNANLPN